MDNKRVISRKIDTVANVGLILALVTGIIILISLIGSTILAFLYENNVIKSLKFFVFSYVFSNWENSKFGYLGIGLILLMLIPIIANIVFLKKKSETTRILAGVFSFLLVFFVPSLLILLGKTEKIKISSSKIVALQTEDLLGFSD